LVFGIAWSEAGMQQRPGMTNDRRDTVVFDLGGMLRWAASETEAACAGRPAA